jgi:hypothetical protein
VNPGFAFAPPSAAAASGAELSTGPAASGPASLPQAPTNSPTLSLTIFKTFNQAAASTVPAAISFKREDKQCRDHL